MKVAITGSSGRVGRAVMLALAGHHQPIGLDRTPFAGTTHVGDIGDRELLKRVFDGVDAIVHTAALHAPQIGHVSDGAFERTNVGGTENLIEAALSAGIGTIVFTSTTALYGAAVITGRCTWIDEATEPQPRNIYHRTKYAAERLMKTASRQGLDRIRVLRMSRCFPEPAPVMAAYRLHRGIDLRDVADAHVAALEDGRRGFGRVIVSEATPFGREDCDTLATEAAAVVRRRAPDTAGLFASRGWPLPVAIDRIYAPARAQTDLGWRSRHGPDEVAAQPDRRSLEVLPAIAP